MDGNNLHAGLGKYVLKEVIRKKRQLLDLEQRIRELSGRLYTTPSVDLEKPLVDHSLVFDRMEKNAVTLQILQEEKEWRQQDLDQFHQDLEKVRMEMDPVLWQVIQQQFLSPEGEELIIQEGSDLHSKHKKQNENTLGVEEGARKETTWEEKISEEKKKALSQLWEVYHQNARKDPLDEARHCLYIKRYYEQMVYGQILTREEAERRMEIEAGMSLRGMYRKIRLLYLEREIRDWVAQGRISETGAYHLSYLKRSQQRLLVSLAQPMKKLRITPKMALTLRECNFSDWYHVDPIREILKSGMK